MLSSLAHPTTLRLLGENWSQYTFVDLPRTKAFSLFFFSPLERMQDNFHASICLYLSTWEFCLYPDRTSGTEKKEFETRGETFLLSLGPSTVIDNEELTDYYLPDLDVNIQPSGLPPPPMLGLGVHSTSPGWQQNALVLFHSAVWRELLWGHSIFPLPKKVHPPTSTPSFPKSKHWIVQSASLGGWRQALLHSLLWFDDIPSLCYFSAPNCTLSFWHLYWTDVNVKLSWFMCSIEIWYWGSWNRNRLRIFWSSLPTSLSFWLL